MTKQIYRKVFWEFIIVLRKRINLPFNENSGLFNLYMVVLNESNTIIDLLNFKYYADLDELTKIYEKIKSVNIKYLHVIFSLRKSVWKFKIFDFDRVSA